MRIFENDFNSHPHEEDDLGQQGSNYLWRISTHILTKRMTKIFDFINNAFYISTHILTKRMTAILNKIISFKIKLYIHYNILFAIFYIYNSILYPFSSPKCSYSGANDSANYCSLAFRTPRFPILSLQIHFSLMQRLCWTNFRAFIAKNAFRSIFSLSGFFINFHVHRTDT